MLHKIIRTLMWLGLLIYVCFVFYTDKNKTTGAKGLVMKGQYSGVSQGQDYFFPKTASNGYLSILQSRLNTNLGPEGGIYRSTYFTRKDMKADTMYSAQEIADFYNTINTQQIVAIGALFLFFIVFTVVESQIMKGKGYMVEDGVMGILSVLSDGILLFFFCIVTTAALYPSFLNYGWYLSGKGVYWAYHPMWPAIISAWYIMLVSYLVYTVLFKFMQMTDDGIGKLFRIASWVFKLYAFCMCIVGLIFVIVTQNIFQGGILIFGFVNSFIIEVVVRKMYSNGAKEDGSANETSQTEMK